MSPLMPDSPSLNQLIRAAINGEKEAQASIFKIYASKMMAVCKRYARTEADAQDLLQEGFIKVFNYLHTFENTGLFDAWIRKVFVNTALKQLNKNKIHFEDITESNYSFAYDETDAVSKLSENEILALLNELPEGYKMVFNLYVIEGYSHKEIGELLEIEESTSRSQLVKARKTLQEKIFKLNKIAI